MNYKVLIFKKIRGTVIINFFSEHFQIPSYYLKKILYLNFLKFLRAPKIGKLVFDLVKGKYFVLLSLHFCCAKLKSNIKMWNFRIRVLKQFSTIFVQKLLHPNAYPFSQLFLIYIFTSTCWNMSVQFFLQCTVEYVIYTFITVHSGKIWFGPMLLLRN